MPKPFPSLLLRHSGVAAQGAFAEAQAAFLDPDPATVQRLKDLLQASDAGVVAHFYMDAELQGALLATGWSRLHISDSLVMADRAVTMAQKGARAIVVLGVDFMSENVRAVLDSAGFAALPVYRVTAEPIGCSLAAAAEAPAYAAYLRRAAATPNALHVVYINTSLRTKAHAQAIVPTITCTSSNVVQTILETFAAQPDANVWFGPDTYMGHNLRVLFERLADLDDAAIAAVHPQHTRASITALLPRFHYFEQGNCIVHHMFGAEVVARVRADYPDAMVTAHLEVPGEMFALALEGQQRGRGVVGSTSDILGYITAQVRAAPQHEPRHLQFVLGTEAGMVTSIVHAVRALLAARPLLTVEIVFPVAEGAVLATGDATLPLVPGVAGGEGCSTAGGCATCPYMKMNSLDALMAVLERIASPAALSAHAPRVYRELIGGRTVAQLGELPILHMREFQRSGHLPAALLVDMRSRAVS
ncbi:MAG: quinolinate synthase NadA [Nannocystis sp.]|uniref:quinolinate synthase NadA n=1 Tax=Nannocystis sp. TaxID=1962667 RepID=UPI00242982C6|nr:quinolinate synthase NadA [Nannocystis sp.]MBK9753606.1 quinolinate synthase NadA [Nannocystis sp.]